MMFYFRLKQPARGGLDAGTRPMEAVDSTQQTPWYYVRRHAGATPRVMLSNLALLLAPVNDVIFTERGLVRVALRPASLTTNCTDTAPVRIRFRNKWIFL